MSVFGCPDQEINRWKHGYVLQGYGLVMDFVIDGVLNLTIDHEFFHLGEVLPSIFRINYCIKEDNPKSQITTQDNYTDWESQLRINTEWPRGKYDIYMISDDCPIGEFQLI